MNKKILAISDYFTPGFLGGGAITTLDNMRKLLVDKVEISVFTRDRDQGSTVPYVDIKANQWLKLPDGPIYYASPENFGVKGLLTAVKGVEYDAIYLNSFFSFRASILPRLIFSKVKRKRPIIIAPRGEFSLGALHLKRYKKKIYLYLAKMLGWYQGVFWHVSTKLEAQDILHIFPEARSRICIASDPVAPIATFVPHAQSEKQTGYLRLAFISRIAPIKNLDGLIKILRGMIVFIQLDIYGPLEDDEYWGLCAQLMATLPENIKATSYGPIAPEAVPATFVNYDLFAFPTRGENFGHVIFEALRAGTPVLVSDQTPWLPDNEGALTVIPIEDVSGWKKAIEAAANRSAEEQKRVSAAATDYAGNYVKSSNSLNENLNVFVKVFDSQG